MSSGFTSVPISGWTKIDGRRRACSMAIQQKLHARLVQKLILTPSLQQAIKLLPMTTLELAELLNQEMVENPMLEEVPTEEPRRRKPRQTAEQPEPRRSRARRTTPGTTPTTSISSANTSTRATGRGSRRKSRNCRRSRTRCRRKSSLADHLMWQLNLQTTDDLTAGNRRGHHRQHRRRRVSGRVGRRDCGARRLGHRGRRARARARADVRSDRRRRARPAGMPAAADPPPRAWPARRSRRSCAITCGCCRTTGFRSSRRRSGIEPEEVKAHIEFIKHLDPKPGSRYSPAESQYVIPDVYIVKTDDGLSRAC